MLGLMQDHPLLISSLLEHARRYHAETEIVSATCEGPVVRSTWGQVSDRAKHLAQALIRLGVRPGDRVATLAWNTHRHVELYYAVSGIGAVLHTVNPRLFPEQIDYIVNHGGSTVLLFDITFAGLIDQLRPALPLVRHFVAMTDPDHMPGSAGDLLCYETLIAAETADYDWPQFDERSASSLCYTSGTTGNPKGVLYSHRSTLLHSMMACQVDGLQVSSADSVLLAVPLFHVNAWGIPYTAAMCGAKLVLPGPKLDGKSLFDLAQAEGCTFSLGVPTVWLGLFKHVDDTPGRALDQLPLRRVMIGGSAAPRAMIERFEASGIPVIHAWGMTETSPVATIGNLLPAQRELPPKDQIDIKIRQGRPVYGVDLRIVDETGATLPQDGTVSGDLLVRGHWITAGYFRNEGGAALDAEGWFPTGDVARIDSDGFVTLTDRSKDVIKSGGEWISSIDLENAMMGHPDVQQAAVIGVHHPKWQERPLLIVVRRPGANPQPADLLTWLADKVVKWWLPDDVVFVDELPHTATGKVQKLKLRERFRDHVLPG